MCGIDSDARNLMSRRTSVRGPEGRHAWRAPNDVPWPKRPRKRIDLRDGWESRVWLAICYFAGGLVVCGLGYLTGIGLDRSPVLGILYLLAGAFAVSVIVVYIRRPPRK